MEAVTATDRQSMQVDIACVGFGPAMGGFLTTLSRAIAGGEGSEGSSGLQSQVMAGLPLQVVCYERADDLGFGVSGVVTRARGIRQSFPGLDPARIPMAHPVATERLVYLHDTTGASRRSRGVRFADAAVRALGPRRDGGVELTHIPRFLRKDDGLVLSIGQFNQWVASELMAQGQVQIWPATPVQQALVEGNRVLGVRLVDQGTDRAGNPEAGFMPGMDVHASLTVVADGPVGPVGRQLDQHFQLPGGHTQRDWAVGMKMVVDLPDSCTLETGTVLHTVGFPEPEIMGFLYVHPDRLASLGIFVPSWFDSPVRTAYRYLQHWMMHPYLWRHLSGARMRSWGAKTLQESGRRGEPYLVGDGYARIGEGSGSTNVLTGSGVDEAWTTGTQCAEAVIELVRAGKPFTRENLEATYVRRRRASWVEAEARIAEKARDGFQSGFLTGMIGMALSGMSRGALNATGPHLRPRERVQTLAEYFAGRVAPDEIARIRHQCAVAGTSLHDALMERAGWPPIPHDGKLLVSHQDALLLGGKVQAPPGYADHVVFLYPHLCERCETRLCIEVCSGEAIAPGTNGVPQFDRDKCVHCGVCLWSCTLPLESDLERGNIDFRAGAGGLHSAEN